MGLSLPAKPQNTLATGWKHPGMQTTLKHCDGKFSKNQKCKCNNLVFTAVFKMLFSLIITVHPGQTIFLMLVSLSLCVCVCTYEEAGRSKRDLPAGTTFTSNRPPTICPPSFVPVHTALFIRKTPAHRTAFNPSGHHRCHGYSWPKWE